MTDMHLDRAVIGPEGRGRPCRRATVAAMQDIRLETVQQRLCARLGKLGNHLRLVRVHEVHEVLTQPAHRRQQTVACDTRQRLRVAHGLRVRVALPISQRGLQAVW